MLTTTAVHSAGINPRGRDVDLLSFRSRCDSPSMAGYLTLYAHFVACFLDKFHRDLEKRVRKDEAFVRMYRNMTEAIERSIAEKRNTFLSYSGLPARTLSIFWCYQAFAPDFKRQRRFLRAVCSSRSPLRAEFGSQEKCNCYIAQELRRAYKKLVDKGEPIPEDVAVILFPERFKPRPAPDMSRFAGKKAPKPIVVATERCQISGALMTPGRGHRSTAVMNPPERPKCFAHHDRTAVTTSFTADAHICHGCLGRLNKWLKDGKISRGDDPDGIKALLQASAEEDARETDRRKKPRYK